MLKRRNAETPKPRWNWMRFYEGFFWGCLVAGSAFIAGSAMGCQVHLHYGEKHYDGGGTEARRHEGTEGEEPTIEAHPHGEPGIEIVMPEGKR